MSASMALAAMQATPIEVVVAAPESLALVVQPYGLEPKSAEIIEASFLPLFTQANKWKAQVAGLKVTDITQTREMKLARESRLALKEIRVLAEKNKDRLKEEGLKRNAAIQALFNTVKGICEPLEAELQAQEQFAVRKEAERIAALKAERVSALRQYGVVTEFLILDVMPADQYEQLLADSKAKHEAKIEADRKAEADRIAKEQAEAAAREAARIEAERLKAEAAAALKAAQEERDRLAAEKAAADLKAKQEREALEAELAKQKVEAAAKAKAAADAAAEEARKVKAESDRLAKIAADKAKAEREAEEARFRAEREAAEKKAQAEREELRRLAKIESDARAAAEAEILAADKAAAMKAVAEETARRKAASAPDKEKILAYSKALRAIPVPAVNSAEAKALVAVLAVQAEKFAVWIEAKGSAL